MICSNCNNPTCALPGLRDETGAWRGKPMPPEFAARYVAARDECNVLRDAGDRTVPYAADFVRERARASELQAQLDALRAQIREIKTTKRAPLPPEERCLHECRKGCPACAVLDDIDRAIDAL